MTRADKLLLAGLLCVSLISGALLYGRLFFTPSSQAPARAVVSVQGKIARSIDLSSATPSSFVVPGRHGPSTVEVAGNRVRMRQAPCPGGICVKQGWIGQPGQSIACVPGEILIRIEGAAPLDAVTR